MQKRRPTWSLCEIAIKGMGANEGRVVCKRFPHNTYNWYALWIPHYRCLNVSRCGLLSIKWWRVKQLCLRAFRCPRLNAQHRVSFRWCRSELDTMEPLRRKVGKQIQLGTNEIKENIQAKRLYHAFLQCSRYGSGVCIRKPRNPLRKRRKTHPLQLCQLEIESSNGGRWAISLSTR